MGEPREFVLASHARPPRWAGVLAVAGVAALAWLIVVDRPVDPSPAAVHGIVRADSAPSLAIPAVRGITPARSAARDAPGVAIVAPRDTSAAAPVEAAAHPMAPVAVDSPPRGAATVLEPGYGDGRLWVRPLVASPRQIASALTGKSQQELADSSVTAMVQTYLDAMAKEQAANHAPKWTTTIGGKTVGLDSRWIYLGPIKIPTMLLALLPIRLQGNPTEAQFNARLQVMRADLFEAARRAQTLDDFKAAVKDEREQVERAREFKRNQSTPPDTSHDR